MTELILILVTFGNGVFMVWLATDVLLNDVSCAIFGIIGGCVMIYALVWALRWLMLGGLLS